MSNVIGLHGKAQSGKDSVCSFLSSWAASIGREVKRDGFADRLKISAAHALGIFKDEIDAMNDLKFYGYVQVLTEERPHGGPLRCSKPISGREYLQYYGTEAHRDVFTPDFWVDAVLPSATKEYCGRDPYDILVITDVRFPNEAARIKECGGEVWHIVRSGQSDSDGHASEQVLPAELIDYRIYNDSTLEALRNEVITMAERRLL